MASGGTFTCTVRESSEMKAAYFTLEGWVVSGPGAHYQELESRIASQRAKQTARYEFDVTNLQNLPAHIATLVVVLASQMRDPTIQGVVVLRGLDPVRHRHLVQASGGNPGAIFQLSGSEEETTKILTEHKATTSEGKTVSLNEDSPRSGVPPWVVGPGDLP